MSIHIYTLHFAYLHISEMLQFKNMVATVHIHKKIFLYQFKRESGNSVWKFQQVLVEAVKIGFKQPQLPR